MKDQEIIDFIGEKVKYDNEGQYFWGIKIGKEHQMIAELRGWGAIQNLFKRKAGTVDFGKATAFQDKLGEFIEAAINEKIARDSNVKERS